MNQPEIKPIIDKAKILIEALPYIQKFNGKTVVIKYGGNAMINDELKNKVMEDITLLKYIGINPIVVHGGGPDISKALKKFDIESEFINGLRVTDEETMRVAQMVLVGKTNKEIVSLLGTKGGKGLGISGIDGGLIECRKCFTEVNGEKVDIGFVGDIVNINERVLDIMTKDDYIPVVAPIGTDSEGNSYNINADYVAAEIAGALHAEKLLLLTDIDGVYKDFEDKDSFISTLTVAEAKEYIKEGIISGGMIPKIEACLKSIEAGTNKVRIIDGRQPHSIILELLTNSGIGTQVVK